MLTRSLLVSLCFSFTRGRDNSKIDLDGVASHQPSCSVRSTQKLGAPLPSGERSFPVLESRLAVVSTEALVFWRGFGGALAPDTHKKPADTL